MDLLKRLATPGQSLIVQPVNTPNTSLQMQGFDPGASPLQATSSLGGGLRGIQPQNYFTAQGASSDGSQGSLFDQQGLQAGVTSWPLSYLNRPKMTTNPTAQSAAEYERFLMSKTPQQVTHELGQDKPVAETWTPMSGPIEPIKGAHGGQHQSLLHKLAGLF